MMGSISLIVHHSCYQCYLSSWMWLRIDVFLCVWRHGCFLLFVSEVLGRLAAPLYCAPGRILLAVLISWETRAARRGGRAWQLPLLASQPSGPAPSFGTGQPLLAPSLSGRTATCSMATGLVTTQQGVLALLTTVVTMRATSKSENTSEEFLSL